MILELGHTIVHAPEYLSGKMKVHSHTIRNELDAHHEHSVLEKIEEAVEKATNNDSKKMHQNMQTLSFDHLKLFSQNHYALPIISIHQRSDFFYLMKKDQRSDLPLTPPPKTPLF